MPDYSLGKIYKITAKNADEGDVYIGSTICKLNERFTKHKYRQSCNVKLLFDKYGLDNCYIELIKEFPCETKEQLINEECYFIRTMKSINKRIENSTIEERVQSKKEYRQKNKEKTKEYLEKNKEKIKEQFRLAHQRRKLHLNTSKII